MSLDLSNDLCLTDIKRSTLRLVIVDYMVMRTIVKLRVYMLKV